MQSPLIVTCPCILSGIRTFVSGCIEKLVRLGNQKVVQRLLYCASDKLTQMLSNLLSSIWMTLCKSLLL